MNNNDLVCDCFGVTVKDIKEAIANGAKSFEDIQNITDSCDGCGQCTDNVREIVERLLYDSKLKIKPI